jgi:hypothetical protein
MPNLRYFARLILDNKTPLSALLTCSLLFLFPAGETAAESSMSEPASAEIKVHCGRPTIFVDGRPLPMALFSPACADPKRFEKTVGEFAAHKMGAYFITVRGIEGEDFFETPFWNGDRISEEPHGQWKLSLDQQAEYILKHDPGAYLIVRYAPFEPANWRALHPDQLAVSEEGERLPCPSLASGLYWDCAARFGPAVVRYSESRPWGARIIGYWYGLRHEGSHEPLFRHLLFDHSELMIARWRAFLKTKYGTVERLRGVWRGKEATFEGVAVPKDKLRGPVPEVSNILYWQNAADNQPLRDYLELQRDLFHGGFRKIAGAMVKSTERKRFYVYDAFKQSMQGWTNFGFFDPNFSWPHAYAELMAGSGHMNVAKLLDLKSFDGVITPHDYQARGIGGIYEPEGCADSTVLRGKIFLSEMDTRSYNSDREKGAYGTARDAQEFEAITWRNLAVSLTRGFHSYWMDVFTDWFGAPELHAVIERQVQVLKESVEWEHRDVPGIAVVIDDTAVLETNGAGNVLNEHVMWDLKTGLSRCGVPYRIYLLEDLVRGDLPKHRVFYFPNLYRLTLERLKLLREKVCRDGNVVVWGPGSGISDGERIGPESATKLTGFEFEFIPANHPQRAMVVNFDHPITKGLPADTLFGGPLAFGPLLLPKDGTMLAMAWTKQGRNLAGLAIKEFGKGARGSTESGGRGGGDWASVFTIALPLPADLWRGLARYAGAHVYCESNDVVLADEGLVAIHSVKSERKQLKLPGEFRVRDVISGELLGERLSVIDFEMKAPETRVFRLERP